MKTDIKFPKNYKLYETEYPKPLPDLKLLRNEIVKLLRRNDIMNVSDLKIILNRELNKYDLSGIRTHWELEEMLKEGIISSSDNDRIFNQSDIRLIKN
ncbi:MAG TPA: hypothetical protein DEP28_08765 [Bacteroidetes bacterium]|nr:hypothetical protein [Ignavibacteria bacterium]HCA43329.1 hypothetical protein [Bacteroidota bacterium]HCN38017.1 hypothetical protein [Bacteroidota bacterium]